jgi:cytochrome c553
MKTVAHRFAETLAVAGMFFASFAAGAPASAPPPQAAICTGCHGAHGEGSASIGAPRLAGRSADEIGGALTAFKSGSRTSATMQGIASTLDEAQIRSLADYYSKQPAPVTAAAK